MNMIIGLVVMYLNGGIHGAHVIGSYATLDECRAKVHAAIEANIPLDELPDGVTVYDLCIDTTSSKSRADGKESTPKPPSTSL